MNITAKSIYINIYSGYRSSQKRVFKCSQFIARSTCRCNCQCCLFVSFHSPRLQRHQILYESINPSMESKHRIMVSKLVSPELSRNIQSGQRIRYNFAFKLCSTIFCFVISTTTVRRPGDSAGMTYTAERIFSRYKHPWWS